MKCNELKDRWFTAYPVEGDQLIEVEVYGRKEVDETIAELIDANEKGQYITQQCFKREVEFRKRIDELNNKNQNSKRELRATKRALWLARAMRAKDSAYKILRDSGIMFAIGDCRGWDKLNTLQKKWQVVANKCRKKAEEYK